MTAWFAVYTRPRAEAMAQEHLRRQGYEVYLPRHVKRRRHARRTDFVLAPLFPRYLFVAIDKLHQRWRPILSTVGVCDLVRQGERPAEVAAELVEELRLRERDGAFGHAAQVQGLRRGDPVRVAAGPFTELAGRFHGMVAADRVFVLLEMLGRSVKVQLPSEVVDPV